ncbi:hypothetical protein HDU98_000847 [Podochytrium sp. JEL0797]|nr:hypothetical protein HDU98_000847 [Podochytrium sp. JEL0797]
MNQQYIVQPGDNAFGIAQRFGISLDQLFACNPWLQTNSHALQPGTVLNIMMAPQEAPPVYVQQPAPPPVVVVRPAPRPIVVVAPPPRRPPVVVVAPSLLRRGPAVVVAPSRPAVVVGGAVPVVVVAPGRRGLLGRR